MPRLIANEYVYSSGGALDDCYDYITSPATHQQQHRLQQQQHIPTAMQTSSIQETTARAKSRSQSPPIQMDSNLELSLSQIDGNIIKPNTSKYTESHQIHTISSSEDEEEVEKEFTLGADNPSPLSDDDSADFEGFDNDDYTTPNSSGLINDASQEDLHNSINYLKRRSHKDFDDYREDSEGVVEAIEVDDDEDIAIGDDGQIMYKSREEVTPVKSQTNRYECNPHTPNKRKKQDIDTFFNAISPTHLKTPPDQIVEINSDSTTNSQKQKRQQINTKFQLNLSQQQQGHKLNNANKCSTESTSEFPVSSPSNPQQPRGGGKYPPRPPLLKNTLPADSFERQLAIITACNPQMTLAEKIQGWVCDDELSDVEDVNMFDEEFKRTEEKKKTDLKLKEKGKLSIRCGAKQSADLKQYDYATFRQMIISNMKAQQNQKNFKVGQGAGGFQGCGKGIETTSGSESSKSNKHIDHDRPSTSAVAQQQLLQQRRSKPQMNLEMAEFKKRIVKDNPKRNQNSTTPPQTSSSDNERDCFQNPKKHTGHDKQANRQIHIHDKLLCPSSSEEANSQDIPSHMLLKSNQRLAQATLNNFQKKSATMGKQVENKPISKNLRCLTDEDIDSVFRLHRLNRDIDKHPTETRSKSAEAAGEPVGLIKMHLDFANENKTRLSLEKKQALFKTPIIPQKYLANATTTQTEIQTQDSIAPTKTLLSSEQSIESPSQPLKSTNACITLEKVDVNKDTKLETKDDNIDLEGVYHQQHEFCNYLGLTGMSTATAMANAVAELAQCNLARRSMRVLRQQQQERKDKSAKKERELKALKIKQIKEMRKRERSGCDASMVVEEILHKSDEGSHSQTSEHTPSSPSLKETKKKISINSITKSSTKSHKSIPLVKNESEIKIPCSLDENNKTEAKQLSEEYGKEITQPVRETLKRQVKQRKQDDVQIEEKEVKNPQKETKEVKSPQKETKDFKENNEENVKIIKEIQYETDYVGIDDNVEDKPPTSSQGATEYRRRSLRSPRLSSSKSKLIVTKCRSEIVENKKKTFKEKEMLQKEKPAELDIKSVQCKIESVADTVSITKSLETKSSATVFKVEDTNKDETNNKPNSGGNEINLADSTKQAAPSSYLLQQKIQMALEESRKSKPSIFIVQSLDSKKEITTKSVSNMVNDKMETTSFTTSECLKPLVSPIKEANILVKPSKFNKKDLKKVFKTRKGKKLSNYNLKSAPKRQLRKRKIIVIKTTTKPDKKLHEKTKEQQKEPRSSPKIKSSKASIKTDVISKNETKSYRTVHTETKDLETYLKQQDDGQTKTRLMAKASALLERSRRMSLRGSSANLKSKLSTKVKRSKHSLRSTRNQLIKPKVNLMRRVATEKRTKSNRKYKLLSSPRESRENVAVRTETEVQTNITAINLLDNENVVVSSTTNTFDERPSSHHPHQEPLTIHQRSPVSLRPLQNIATYNFVSSPPVVETKEQFTQSNVMGGGRGSIRYLNAPPSPTQTMHNPLKSENGVVLYIYYELDILIVIQERLVSFWKCSKLINLLSSLPPTKSQQNKVGHQSSTLASSSSPKQYNSDIWCNSHLSGVRQTDSSSTFMESQICGEWIELGELRRLNCDSEIAVPFANRICLHNSTTIYLEMRARQLPKNHRDCNMLSMYINIYYYHDEDMIAKCNSIHLDTIQSDIKSVNYTTLIDSRYFIMTWPQENLLGKTRSGLCKYSLTPQLDTLASIREFKSMRHTIRYLECMSDDKLIGFGDTQVTIWDHRSGDVLMNFDLEMPMGKNLCSVYFSSQDIEQNNMLILYQYRDLKNDTPPELLTIACTITHSQPSYRVLLQYPLPMPAFKIIKSAINTGDHLVISGQNDEEIWISTTNPSLVALIPTHENKRFYNRERSQLIELTEKTLNINTLTNHVLQLAAGLALNLKK